MFCEKNAVLQGGHAANVRVGGMYCLVCNDIWLITSHLKRQGQEAREVIN